MPRVRGRGASQALEVRCLVLSLPQEVFEIIVDFVDQAQTTWTLARCCKTFRSFLVPRIYKTIEINEWRISNIYVKPQGYFDIDHNNARRQLAQAVLHFVHRPDLAKYVRELRIIPPHEMLGHLWVESSTDSAASNAPYTYRYPLLRKQVRAALKSLSLPESLRTRLSKELDGSDDSDSYFGILLTLLPNLRSLDCNITLAPKPINFGRPYWGTSWISDILQASREEETLSILGKVVRMTIRGQKTSSRAPKDWNHSLLDLAYDQCLTKAWHAAAQIPTLTDLTLSNIYLDEIAGTLNDDLMFSKNLKRLELSTCTEQDPFSTIHTILHHCPPLETLVLFYGMGWDAWRHRSGPPLMLSADAMITACDLKHAQSLKNLSIGVKDVYDMPHRILLDQNLHKFTRLERLHIHQSCLEWGGQHEGADGRRGMFPAQEDPSKGLHRLTELLSAYSSPTLEELRVSGLKDSSHDMAELKRMKAPGLPNLRRLMIDQDIYAMRLEPEPRASNIFDLALAEGVECIILGLETYELGSHGSWNVCYPMRNEVEYTAVRTTWDDVTWTPRAQSPAAM